MTKRDQAKKMYLDSNGSMPLKEIASKLDVSDGSVRGWKSRYKWDDELYGNGVTLQRNATTSKRSATKKRNTPKKRKEQKNRSGNPNPKNQFTKRNSAAVTHGFFRKYFPENALEIMESMNDRTPADLIWDQIQIQYAAIIRAQQIMYVTAKDEMIKELKKQKFEVKNFGDGEEKDYRPVETEREYEFQFAWDRHATFMNAQSRAMSELRSLIKQFNEMAHEDDERRLKLEQMQLSVDKSKLELSQLRGDTENDAHEQGKSYEEALNAQIEDVFDDEVDEHEET